jgi:hypothetical protein
MSEEPPELSILISDVTIASPDIPSTDGFQPLSSKTSVSILDAVPTGNPAIPQIKKDRGDYIMSEDDLSQDEKDLLHGRAFVVDREIITELDPMSPRTYYIAYDQVQGLVVPARSIVLENTSTVIVMYRWTDDGVKWGSWITLDINTVHTYEVEQKCRFAEVQVYSASSGGIISIVGTR